MKRYPLQTLLRLREHRTDAARMALFERQRAVQACRDACIVIEAEIVALQFERGQQRRRLLDAPPANVSWPTALAQREAHIDWLGLQVQGAQERLRQAQQVLREAEQALAVARAAYVRAKSRQDALEKRKEFWRGEQHAIEIRNEEAVTSDFLMSRHATGKTH